MENDNMKTQNTKNMSDEDNGAVIADAARHAVITESKIDFKHLKCYCKQHGKKT